MASGHIQLGVLYLTHVTEHFDTSNVNITLEPQLTINITRI